MQLTLAHERRLRHWVYGSGFFLNASFALVAYLNSSLLEKFVSENLVGLIYTATYLVAFILALYFHRLIEKTGVYEAIKGLVVAAALTRVGVAIFANSVLSVPILMIDLIVGFLLTASLDLYLEHLSENSITGWIRGLFLALVNFAWLASPFLATQLNSNFGFNVVYLAGGLALLPFIWIAFDHLIPMPRREYHHSGIFTTIKHLYRAGGETRMADISRVISLDFLLQFFYALMVVYLPLLLQAQGFSWTQIGAILTIMFIPFVVLDLALGRVADRVGEKELIIAGLAVAGLATLVIPFLTTSSVLIWGAVLFATRCGAATIELMKESYLFKRVDSEDIGIIFLSRGMYPLSYIVAPLVASAILVVGDIPIIFAILGTAVFAGIPIAWNITDTK